MKRKQSGRRTARRADLESRLGYRFKDEALLERALTHRSYAHESGKRGARHYERLEFLGDSLLGFVVSEMTVSTEDRKWGTPGYRLFVPMMPGPCGIVRI